MNYNNIYIQLVFKRMFIDVLSNDITYEKHHIVPRSECGFNDNSNIVKLTTKEHIFAHQLLARIYNDDKMWFAAHYMLCTRDNPNNKCLRIATIAKEHARQLLSKINMGNCNAKGHVLSQYARDKISQANKGRVPPIKGKHFSEESKQKLSTSLKGHTPWNKGLKMNEKIIAAMRINSKRRMQDVNLRKRISESLKGNIPWNKGKTGIYNQETINKIARAQVKMIPIVQIDMNGKIVREFPSVYDAAIQLGIKEKYIKRVVRGERKQHKGFVYKYKKEIS